MKALLLLFTFYFNLIYLQNPLSVQELLVKGVIIEKGTNIRIASAVITNKRSGIIVGSNELGIFQIKANIGDTLMVQKLNFVNIYFTVKGDRNEQIFLSRETTNLDEVTIKGKTKAEELREMRAEYRKQGSFFEGRPPLRLLNPLGGSPLTFFYELFGKTPAKARRFRKYYNKESDMLKIDQVFNKTLVTKYSDLSGIDLDKFMLDYYPTKEMVKNWNNYDAADYIKKSVRKFTDTLKK